MYARENSLRTLKKRMYDTHGVSTYTHAVKQVMRIATRCLFAYRPFNVCRARSYDTKTSLRVLPSGVKIHFAPAGVKSHFTPAGVKSHFTPAGRKEGLSPAGRKDTLYFRRA